MNNEKKGGYFGNKGRSGVESVASTNRKSQGRGLAAKSTGTGGGGGVPTVLKIRSGSHYVFFFFSSFYYNLLLVIV